MSLERLLQTLADPSGVSWKDETYDLLDAKSLSPSDRAVYVAKLTEHAEGGDTRAIMTLGHLQATEALPALEAAAKSSDAWAPTARRALVLLGKGASVLPQIADDAVHAKSTMQRIAAMLDLGKLGGPVAIKALQQAILDPDNIARGIACDSLVEALGLTKQIQPPDGGKELTTNIEVLQVMLTSEIPALVKIGASRIHDLVRRLGAGEAPDQLGLTWRPRTDEDVFENIRESLFDADVPYKIDEISTLKGPRRLLAEIMLVLRIPHDDERVPEALVKLGAAWTAPVLEELAASPALSSELQKKLADAAHKLASSKLN